MLNIEIKARYPDLEKGARIAERLGGRLLGTDQQTDTYYTVPNGRLKLRTSTLSPNYLIGYHRPDQTGPKQSQYTLFEAPAPANLHIILKSTLGVWLEVRKARTIYLIDNVRVHLDDVRGLGRFLEFEAVIRDGRTPEEGHQQVQDLLQEFGVRPEDLIEDSYSDLLARQANASPRE
jgi:predicted adenylyl cyclase CyaB